MPSHIPSTEQFLLFTLMAKLAVGAVLATMLVRFPWFRRILLTEKRDWPDRLVFAASLGLPLTAGVIWRLLLNNNAADLTLSGAFLAGLLAGPYAGAIVGVMLGIPPTFAGEWGALPFAIGCGFAGGGLRELCPPEAIWHFSPLFFTSFTSTSTTSSCNFPQRLAVCKLFNDVRHSNGHHRCWRALNAAASQP